MADAGTKKLWARVEAACGLTPKPIAISAETAWRLMTRRDAYVNMLRTTIAVAAAALGGADSIVALPHTAPYGLPDALARRIARNTQLVLLEESNLARVVDPAAGSGAIEAVAPRALHRRLVAVSGVRTSRRRMGGADRRHVPAKGLNRARRTPGGGGPPHRYPDRHQRIPRSSRESAAGSRRSATAACPRRRPETRHRHRRGAAADPACRAVRTPARTLRTKYWQKPACGRGYFWRRWARLRISPRARRSPRISLKPAASKPWPAKMPQPSRHRARRSPACAAPTRFTTARRQPPRPPSRTRAPVPFIWPGEYGPERGRLPCGRYRDLHLRGL